jgi:hypothetical protein
MSFRDALPLHPLGPIALEQQSNPACLRSIPSEYHRVLPARADVERHGNMLARAGTGTDIWLISVAANCSNEMLI